MEYNISISCEFILNSKNISTMVFSQYNLFLRKTIQRDHWTMYSYKLCKDKRRSDFQNSFEFSECPNTSSEWPICKPKYLHRNIFWIEFTATINSWAHCSACIAPAAAHSKHSLSISFVWSEWWKTSRKKSTEVNTNECKKTNMLLNAPDIRC